MSLGPRDGLIFNLIKVVGHVPIPEATDLFPARGGIIVHNYRNPPSIATFLLQFITYFLHLDPSNSNHREN